MKQPRPSSWKWTVCGLLLLATMLNYMDRQTLAQLAKTICDQYLLSNEQYGNLEMSFGLAFAAGALFFGFLVDHISPYGVYPLVLLGWSCAGIATGYADRIGAVLLNSFPSLLSGNDATPFESDAAYVGFISCRIVLGFFEAGHWPCALVTTQVILSRKDRSFGNSILQSGAAFGAILTPPIVIYLLQTRPGPDDTLIVEMGGWRFPFVAIGVIGMAWIVPWLTMVRRSDLDRSHEPPATFATSDNDAVVNEAPLPSFGRRFAALVVGVLMINITWQYFRAWLPKFLEEQHHYSLREVGFFTSAYYIATDVGCITVGIVVEALASAGWGVHAARMLTFGICALLTLLAVVAAFLPAGPLLLVLLLVIGAGALGLFPNYYSFTQELSRTHQGKITGVLGTIAWVGSSILQRFAGKSIDETKSYATGIVIAGVAPLIAWVALWFLWDRKPKPGSGPA